MISILICCSFPSKTISLASVELTLGQILLPTGQIKSAKCIRLNKLGYRFRNFVELKEEMFTRHSLTLMTRTFQQNQLLTVELWNYLSMNLIVCAMYSGLLCN